MKKWVFISLLLTTLLSCERGVPTQFTTAGLELNSILNESKTLLSQVDTLNMRAYPRQIDNDLAAIEQALKASGDTLNKETWLFLSDYRGHRKALDRLGLYYAEQQTELRLCKRQWDALTVDVYGGLVAEENMVAYANDELTAARRLKENCQTFQNKLQKRLINYREAQSDISQIKTKVGAPS